MRLAFIAVIVAVLVVAAWAQTTCAVCVRQESSGPSASRSLKPYTGAPEDLRPFSKFTTPYYEYYQDLIEYNGAARDIPDPDLKDLSEIRIGFLAPLYDHPDQVFGNRMLNGAQDGDRRGQCRRRLRRQAIPHSSLTTTTTTGRSVPRQRPAFRRIPRSGAQPRTMRSA